MTHSGAHVAVDGNPGPTILEGHSFLHTPQSHDRASWERRCAKKLNGWPCITAAFWLPAIERLLLDRCPKKETPRVGWRKDQKEK